MYYDKNKIIKKKNYDEFNLSDRIALYFGLFYRAPETDRNIMNFLGNRCISFVFNFIVYLKYYISGGHAYLPKLILS